MLSESICNELRNVFKLDDLQAGFQPLNLNNRRVELFVDYIWAITIRAYGELTIAGIHIYPSTTHNFPGLHQNVMWLQSYSLKDPGRKTPVYPVNLSVEENDPIADSLQSMNLLPIALPAFGTDLPDKHEYELLAVTPFGVANYRYDGIPQSENMRKFWDTVKWKVKSLAAIYRNADMDRSLTFIRVRA